MCILKISTVKIAEIAIKKSYAFSEKMKLEADILHQSCAARGQPCDGFCCRAVHKHVMAGLGNHDAQHAGDGDDSFCSSSRTGLHAAPPPSVCSEPCSALLLASGKTEMPFLMQPVMGASFP